MLKSSSSGMLSVFAREGAATPQPPAKPRPSVVAWVAQCFARCQGNDTNGEHATRACTHHFPSNGDPPMRPNRLLYTGPCRCRLSGRACTCRVAAPSSSRTRTRMCPSWSSWRAERRQPSSSSPNSFGRAPTASPRSVTRKRNLMDQFDGQIASREVAETPPPFGAPSSSRQRL